MTLLKIIDTYVSRRLPSELRVYLSGRSIGVASLARAVEIVRARRTRRGDRRRSVASVLRRSASDVDAAQPLCSQNRFQIQTRRAHSGRHCRFALHQHEHRQSSTLLFDSFRVQFCCPCVGWLLLTVIKNAVSSPGDALLSVAKLISSNSKLTHLELLTDGDFKTLSLVFLFFFFSVSNDFSF